MKISASIIRKIHFYSGLTLSLFISIHLFNHLTIYWGEDIYLEFMESFRVVYRNIIVETLLIGIVMIQIVSGINMAKRKKFLKSYDKLHVYSGFYLSFFLIAHVSAILIGRCYFNLDTNLYFGAATLNLSIFPLIFIPYYGLAIFSFFTHIACILRIKMLIRNPEKNYNFHAKIIIASGLIIAILLIIGLIGVNIPVEYKVPFGM
ncbi:MAG: hypothetical protein MK207_02520 [Saprospiraceae bacterium]|nr:hypothetical protein [Saprospiraceae bacterium]